MATSKEKGETQMIDKTEIYYYKLDKNTGKVSKTVLNARETHRNHNPMLIEYRFRHPCGNTATLPIEKFDKVSDAGVWLVSFRNDTKAATSLFKEYWKDKTIEATSRYEDAMIWYSKCKNLFDLISE